MPADSLVHAQVDVRVCGTVMLIAAAGEIDISVHDKITAALQTATMAELDVTIDLGAITFIDLSTVALLARAAATQGAAGRWLLVTHPQPEARRLFRLMQEEHLLAPRPFTAPEVPVPQTPNRIVVSTRS